MFKRLIWAVALGLCFSVASVVNAGYLSVKNGKLVNTNGQVIRITGVNWFGFETGNMIPHGLWARDYHGMLLQIKKLGFNTVRIPFCNAMLREDAKVNSLLTYGIDSMYVREKPDMNKELVGKTPIEILDEIINYAGEIGLAIMLDNHSREPDGYMTEKVWYTSKTSEELFISDWVMLAKRYKNNPTVIGFDLENEPHGKWQDTKATWGTGNPLSDWNTAAEKCGNAILKENPDVLIIVEGVEEVGTQTYWWGGNLQGVKTHPVKLIKPEKLVYSPHEYGPEVFAQEWFDAPAFPNNMEQIWDHNFGYIAKNGIAPLMVGEFGINKASSHGGKAGIWFDKFLKYMTDNGLSWTFWCFNPNSGDTGGLLSYDWYSVETWKMDALKPHLDKFINEPRGSSGIKTIKTLQKLPKSMISITNNTISLSTDISSTGSSYSITIVNLHGKLVKSINGSSLGMASLPSGTYFALAINNQKIMDKIQFTVAK
jgi:aryl-phospho-beta-D-glucosidase BglC (GH1 family)